LDAVAPRIIVPPSTVSSAGSRAIGSPYSWREGTTVTDNPSRASWKARAESIRLVGDCSGKKNRLTKTIFRGANGSGRADTRFSDRLIGALGQLILRQLILRLDIQLG